MDDPRQIGAVLRAYAGQTLFGAGARYVERSGAWEIHSQTGGDPVTAWDIAVWGAAHGERAAVLRISRCGE